MSPQPEELRDLVAAYALDAIEPDERTVVERAIAADPELQRELAGHREVLAQLAPEATASPDLLDRILAALPDNQSISDAEHTVAGPTTASAAATEISLDEARQSRTGQVARAVLAAVAVVALLLLGVGLVRNDKPDDIPGLAEQALGDPAAEVLTLSVPEAGGDVARAAVYPDGQGFLVVDDLPQPDAADGETYQLWMLPDQATDPDGSPISLGLVPPNSEAVAFQTAPGNLGLALSIEPDGGSTEPTLVFAVGEPA